MTTGDSATPPAGWYADPYGADVWRYWDGTQWTDHVAPRSLEQTPADALADERRYAVWARWAFVAYVVLVAATATLGALYFDKVYAGHLFDADSRPNTDAVGAAGLLIAYQVCAFASLGVIAVLALWTYRAAKTARALGLPIRREPGLALASWFIPIVNLWWPPQTIRSFVPDRDQLRVAIEWWVCWIVTSFALAASLFAAGAGSISTAIPFIVIATLGAAAFAVLGFHVVRIVLEVHEQLVEERHLTEV